MRRTLVLALLTSMAIVTPRAALGQPAVRARCDVTPAARCVFTNPGAATAAACAVVTLRNRTTGRTLRSVEVCSGPVPAGATGAPVPFTWADGALPAVCGAPSRDMLANCEVRVRVEGPRERRRNWLAGGGAVVCVAGGGVGALAALAWALVRRRRRGAVRADDA